MDERCAAAERAGAVAAVVAAMRAHPQRGGVQGNGCGLLANLCASFDADADARRRRAAAEGAIEVAVDAGDAGGMGATALRALCGDDEELRARAVAAGSDEAIFEPPPQ